VGLAYHDGTQWLPAADAAGNVLSGGEGWMVPDSRVNHVASNPVLIEVQVYHFSGTQAVVFAAFDGTREEEDRPPGENRSGAVVFVSCFVDSVSSDSKFIFWPFSLVVGMIILICGLRFFMLKRKRRFIFRTAFRLFSPSVPLHAKLGFWVQRFKS
jgi:hypothetical protein